MTPFPQVVRFYDPKQGGTKDNISFGIVIAWVYTSHQLEGVVKVFTIDGLPERFEHIVIASLYPSSYIEFNEWKKKHGL